MPQSDLIKDIARYGLENDQEKLLSTLEELITISRQSNKIAFALQLQSVLKDALRQSKTSSLTNVRTEPFYSRVEEREISDFILEKVASDYSFGNLISSPNVTDELRLFIREHAEIDQLRALDLPVSNKVLFHGPSGCGKTLASYVLAGELRRLMLVVNLGAIVSSKLGETSRNLAKVFRRAAAENCVIFLDEFDSLGKIRDYNQDHGEMKRVVNTILQLFDFMPNDCIVIAATNQINMIDDALMRRFDVNIEFKLPNPAQIKALIALTLRNGRFQFDHAKKLPTLITQCRGLSFYSIQKTLISAIKRSLFDPSSGKATSGMSDKINTATWSALIQQEKKALGTHRPSRKRKA
jgi:AAA+ superfamily predicted ATPase